MGCQSWHMACTSCYLGAFENLLNSILDTAQLCVSFPRLLLGVLHNKFISCIRRIAPSKITGTSMLHFFWRIEYHWIKGGNKPGHKQAWNRKIQEEAKILTRIGPPVLKMKKKKWSIEHIEIFLKKQLIPKVMPLKPLSQGLAHNKG